MALTIGTRLGPYEILGPVGAGGMGEVYRARDTRLDRTVAIKILPHYMSDSSLAQQRFEREAKAISSLSHPSICQLYDIGHQDGTDYLVLEYLPGETLQHRLERGPMPVEQVLKLGVEIADALEKAHAKGLVHRDLKPSNLMLTKSGAKLLDFGLAKPSASGINSVLTAITRSEPLTTEGTILGTYHYMSPEQVEGRDADARSDIFALGAVLFEATTGTRAFDGRTQATVIAAVLERDPAPISSLQPMAPLVLDRVVQTCLKKDPDERFQTAHDLKLQLQWIADGLMGSGTHVAPLIETHRQRYFGLRAMWAGVVVLALIAAGAAWMLGGKPAQPSAPTLWFELGAPTGAQFTTADKGSVEVSPDGRDVVFTAESNGKTNLWVRELDSLELRQLRGTEGAMFPFWSPDSRSVGFFVGNKLRRVRVGGGDPETVATVNQPLGGSWSGKGVMLVGSENDGIYKVNDTGGLPERLTQVDTALKETTHRWPSFLPDGEHFLFVCGEGGTSENNHVCTAALSAPKPQRVLAATSNAEYAAGYVFYYHEGGLHAHPFDAKKMVTTGPPVHIVERVNYDEKLDRAMFSVTEGLIAYQPSTTSEEEQWLNPARTPPTGVERPKPVTVVTEWKRILAKLNAEKE